MTLRFIPLLVCFAVLGCAHDGPIHDTKPAYDGTTTEQHRQWMIGKWLGETTSEDGEKQIWLVERAADGTYKLTFRAFSEFGFFDERVEVGNWGVKADIYFTIMTGWLFGTTINPADMTNHVFYDAYEIVHIDNSSFEYISKGSGSRYRVDKVSDSFELP